MVAFDIWEQMKLLNGTACYLLVNSRLVFLFLFISSSIFVSKNAFWIEATRDRIRRWEINDSIHWGYMASLQVSRSSSFNHIVVLVLGFSLFLYLCHSNFLIKGVEYSSSVKYKRRQCWQLELNCLWVKLPTFPFQQLEFFF